MKFNRFFLFYLFCFFFCGMVRLHPDSYTELENPYLHQIFYGEEDEYTIEEELGSGAFGEVYSAKGLKGDKVAIKVYRNLFDEDIKFFFGTSWPTPIWSNPNKKDDITMIELYRPEHLQEKEWTTGFALESPQIVQVLDKGTYQNGKKNIYFLVMEYIEGQTLADIIYGDDQKIFSKEQTLELALDLLDGLSYALAFDHYHSDLHSGNLMITSMGHLKLVDLSSFIRLESADQEGEKSSFNHSLIYFFQIYELIKNILATGSWLDSEIKQITHSLKPSLTDLRSTYMNSESKELLYTQFVKWIDLVHKALLEERQPHIKAA